MTNLDSASTSHEGSAPSHPASASSDTDLNLKGPARTRTTFGSSRYPDGLQWRMQYGRRPPKKTGDQQDIEQKMIEHFLKNKVEAPVTPTQKSSSASLSEKDQKLVAKFFQKRVSI